MEFIRPVKKNQYIYVLHDENYIIQDVRILRAPYKNHYPASSIGKDREKRETLKYQGEIDWMLAAGYENSGHFVFEGVVDFDADNILSFPSGKSAHARLAGDHLWTILRRVTSGEMEIKGEMKIHGVWELIGQDGDLYIKVSKLI